jgi:uncharacterized C2H2 Zn-finger protein
MVSAPTALSNSDGDDDDDAPIPGRPLADASPGVRCDECGKTFRHRNSLRYHGRQFSHAIDAAGAPGATSREPSSASPTPAGSAAVLASPTLMPSDSAAFPAPDVVLIDETRRGRALEAECPHCAALLSSKSKLTRHLQKHCVFRHALPERKANRGAGSHFAGADGAVKREDDDDDDDDEVVFAVKFAGAPGAGKAAAKELVGSTRSKKRQRHDERARQQQGAAVSELVAGGTSPPPEFQLSRVAPQSGSAALLLCPRDGCLASFESAKGLAQHVAKCRAGADASGTANRRTPAVAMQLRPIAVPQAPALTLLSRDAAVGANSVAVAHVTNGVASEEVPAGAWPSNAATSFALPVAPPPPRGTFLEDDSDDDDLAQPLQPDDDEDEDDDAFLDDAW